MSASLTAVCNKALADVRADNTLSDITDVTDTSAEAQACRTYVYDIIGEVLEEYDWRWASREKSLGAIHADDPPEGWSYRYLVPNDCVVPREVLSEGKIPNTDKNAFVEVLSADGSERTLSTNIEDAILRYTSDALSVQVELWPNNFTNCVRHKLAHELGMALKNSPQIAESSYGRYRMALASARYVDGAGNDIGPSQRPGSLRART